MTCIFQQRGRKEMEVMYIPQFWVGFIGGIIFSHMLSLIIAVLMNDKECRKDEAGEKID